MPEAYKNKLSEILNDIRPGLSSGHHLRFKNSFGAVAGYLNDKIFIVYGKFGLALKLPEKSVQMLLSEKGFKPLKYFKNGHVKKSYVVVCEEILSDKRRFKQLLNKSIKLTEDS